MSKLDELLEKATDARATILKRETGLGVDSEAGTAASTPAASRVPSTTSNGGSAS